MHLDDDSSEAKDAADVERRSPMSAILRVEPALL